MKTILETVIEFFRNQDIKFHQSAEDPVLKAGFSGKNGRFSAIAIADDQRRSFEFYTVCPLTVPEEKRPMIAELIARINWNLLLGSFDLDMDDGEIRFRTSIKLGKDQLSEEILLHTIFSNVVSMDLKFPGLAAAILTNASVSEAMSIIEDHKGRPSKSQKSITSEDKAQGATQQFGGRLGGLLGGSNN